MCLYNAMKLRHCLVRFLGARRAQRCCNWRRIQRRCGGRQKTKWGRRIRRGITGTYPKPWRECKWRNLSDVYDTPTSKWFLSALVDIKSCDPVGWTRRGEYAWHQEWTWRRIRITCWVDVIKIYNNCLSRDSFQLSLRVHNFWLFIL